MQTTFYLAKHAYKKLKNKHPDILSFNNFEEFLIEAEGLGDVVGDGTNSWLCRKRNDMMKTPADLQVSTGDENRVSFPVPDALRETC